MTLIGWGALTAAFGSLNLRHGLYLWLAAVCLTPFWAGPSFGLYIPPITLVSLALLPALMAAKPRPDWNRMDGFVVALAALCVILGVAGAARVGDVSNVVTQWVPAFVVGKRFVQILGGVTVYRAITLFMTAVAALAIVEFSAGWNPYFDWRADNGQYEIWAFDQVRAGITRSEWSFGHAISLSLCLAMTVPMAFASRLRPWLLTVSLVLIGLATVMSFSRAGMASTVLAFALCIAFQRGVRSRARLAVGFIGVAAIWFVAPLISSVFENAGEEAAGSAQYRLRLLALISSMRFFGLAKGYQEPEPGVVYFGSFRSIDNAYLLFGLNFGYIALILVIGGAVWFVIDALSGPRRSPAALSVIAVLPSMLTVAMITQFGGFFFFFLGMASALRSALVGPGITTAASQHLPGQTPERVPR